MTTVFSPSCTFFKSFAESVRESTCTIWSLPVILSTKLFLFEVSSSPFTVTVLAARPLPLVWSFWSVTSHTIAGISLYQYSVFPSFAFSYLPSACGVTFTTGASFSSIKSSDKISLWFVISVNLYALLSLPNASTTLIWTSFRLANIPASSNGTVTSIVASLVPLTCVLTVPVYTFVSSSLYMRISFTPTAG